LPTNDAMSLVPLDASLRNLRASIVEANSAGVRVLVIGPQPRRMGPTGTRILRAWAHSLDTLSGVETVHVWDSLAKDSSSLRPWLSRDSIHPNDSGHAILYRQVLRSRTWKELFGTDSGTTP